MKVGNLKKYYRKKGPKLVVTPVVGIVLIGFIATWIWVIPHGQRLDTSTYQVVYLTTGQAYFGKLQNTDGNYLVLTSPYVVQSIQQPNSEKKTSATSSDQTTLIKVKDQVYGPDDSMALRADNVLFWQNLRNDSKVTKAIQAKEQ